jgi:hypothetical protein
MKAIFVIVTIMFAATFLTCKKETATQQIISIPNGDFELWDNTPSLYNWQTNSCPLCLPPFETYIVRKVTDVSGGQFAAKFIYNNVYSSYAINKFPVSVHPTLLTGYIKSSIAAGDTAIIRVELYSGGNIVDKGNFYETSSNTAYRKIQIPVSQVSATVDSAFIKIIGGKKQNTELFVDDLVFLKNGQ